MRLESATYYQTEPQPKECSAKNHLMRMVEMEKEEMWELAIILMTWDAVLTLQF
jgi:hypothetical protein